MEPRYAEFLIASLVMELTPGPNLAWLAMLSAHKGVRSGLFAVAGVFAGLAILALLSGAGVAALLTSYPALYETFRWAGVAFLVYLAADAWFGFESPPRDGEESRRYFMRGLVINMLNPKAALVFVVLIPGFAGTGADASRHLLAMTAIYLAIATAAHASIVVFARWISALTGLSSRETLIRRVSAILLVAVAIWLALTTGRSS